MVGRVLPHRGWGLRGRGFSLRIRGVIASENPTVGLRAWDSGGEESQGRLLRAIEFEQCCFEVTAQKELHAGMHPVSSAGTGGSAGSGFAIEHAEAIGS